MKVGSPRGKMQNRNTNRKIWSVSQGSGSSCIVMYVCIKGCVCVCLMVKGLDEGGFYSLFTSLCNPAWRQEDSIRVPYSRLLVGKKTSRIQNRYTNDAKEKKDHNIKWQVFAMDMHYNV